jgi:hypothetical protein
MMRLFFTFFLILFAALSRLLPHPANFVPITAIALFGGVYLDKKHTFIVPVAALLISDYFIGFYSGWQWVYGSFIAIGFIGLWLRNHKEVIPVIGASLVGSLLFFVVTNFGVWITSLEMYPRTFSGLLECYVAAIPFFRNTLAGDLFYVGAMFGIFELSKKYIPALKPELTA